jgi:polyketide biosynthesis acyl carrier protein
MNSTSASVNGGRGELQMSVDEVFAVITRHTCEVLPELDGHEFQFADSLKNLGANSVDRSEILIMTLESLALNIPLRDTAPAQNMGELAALLHEKLSA